MKMQEELRAFLEQKDREAVQELHQRGHFESKGLVSRTVLTSVGKVRIRVHRFCARKSGRVCYPLCDLYGLEGITPCARAFCVAVAIERSYAWSTQALRLLRGMDISRMRLWQVIQEEGRRVQAARDAMRQTIFDRAQGVPEQSDHRRAVVEVDGTMLASQERTAEADFQGRKRMEVKLGVVFRGVARVGRRRHATQERSVYASVVDVDTFSEQFSAHCTLQGIGPDTPVQYVGDGAKWIQTVRQAVFPHSRYTLDWYHVQAAAHRVLLPRQRATFCALVKAGLVQTAISFVQEVHPADATHAHELHTFVQYLQDNRNGMHYRVGEIHGSGVIEKMVDLVVKKRMKRQGMRWSQRGANTLLALRSQHINEDFHRRHQASKPCSMSLPSF